MLAPGASVGGKISNEDWADAANGWGWVSVFGVVAGGVGVDADRRRAARLAGAGRALRRGAGGARAPRRHRRWGVAIAIGVPLLAILALVTLVGIPFGVALLLAAIPVLLVAYATTAWIVGRRVLRNRSTSPWAALLAGWGILRVLALIPVAGALVGLAATVVGLGALAVALWRARRPGAPAARPEAPAAGRPAPAA